MPGFSLGQRLKDKCAALPPTRLFSRNTLPLASITHSNPKPMHVPALDPSLHQTTPCVSGCACATLYLRPLKPLHTHPPLPRAEPPHFSMRRAWHRWFDRCNPVRSI